MCSASIMQLHRQHTRQDVGPTSSAPAAVCMCVPPQPYPPTLIWHSDHCRHACPALLSRWCLSFPGPKSQLDDTIYSQPALFVANLAALEVLKAQDPGVVSGARLTAGLSLGEYCALVAAGAISFSDGLKVWLMTVIGFFSYWLSGAQVELMLKSIHAQHLNCACQNLRLSQ